MDTNRLSKEELIYELRIRGLTAESTVDEMRRKIRPLLRLEREGKAMLPVYETSTAEDLDICKGKINALEALITELDETASEHELRKIDTGLQHVTNRVNRVRPEDSNTEAWQLKRQLADKCAELWALCEERDPKVKQEVEETSSRPSGNMIELDRFGKILTAIRVQVAYITGDRGSPVARQLEDRLADLLSRLTLLSTEDEEEENVRLGYLEESMECLQEFGRRMTSGTAGKVERIDPCSEPVIKKIQVPLKDWGIKFSGDDQSVHAFLEAIEEMKSARNASDADLFNSAFDLFSGRALIWLKAIRRETSSWEEIVQEMRNEFEPLDYTERLWEEIRSRTQGEDEKIGFYVSVMRNYFHRLPQKPTENEVLRIVLRNLHPYYLERLGLQKISSLAELVEKGRRIEDNRWRMQMYRPPPLKKTLLEPDLAYLPPNRKTPSTASVAVVGRTEATSSSNATEKIQSPKERRSTFGKCWNCDQNGHSFRWCKAAKQIFCERCGRKQVETNNCQCQQRQENSLRGRVKEGAARK